MRLGVTVRNMGPQSTAVTMATCIQHAEQCGFESAWITDHIAIPPDDAQGSGGRYTDPLGTLAWMAGQTNTIKLGTGVLILPYRAALPTAKLIATVQELSGERLLLGVGVGWMDAEFRALGVDRHQRGAISDQTLELFNNCFSQDEVTLNEQTFIFKPRPAKPPILVGGRPPHALARAAVYGDGWLPMARVPEQIATPIKEYRRLTKNLGKADGEICVLTSLPIGDKSQCLELLHQYAELGVDRIVSGLSYQTAQEYCNQLDQLAADTA